MIDIFVMANSLRFELHTTPVYISCQRPVKPHDLLHWSCIFTTTSRRCYDQRDAVDVNNLVMFPVNDYAKSMVEEGHP